MKNLKKVLALVLACVMVFGTVAMAGSVYPDVADDAIYAESVKALSALGIIKGDENGNFNPDATITRAEMAKILCTMLGTGELGQANTIFSDVPSSHWASGYVNYAQQYGCIAGYGDGTFGPEDPVTYEQVIKLVMAALGYTTKAEENGGYPTGYLYVAADREVTERAIGNGPEPASRGTVAILVCNAMNTPVMERVTYGTEALWEELDGETYGNNTHEFKTLLTSRHKVYKVEGKVSESYKGNSSLKEGFVNTTITDTLKVKLSWLGVNKYEVNYISAAGTDAADYVGYESYLYYKVDATGDVSLICVSPKSARNKSIVIDDMTNIYNKALGDNAKPADIPQVKDGNFDGPDSDGKYDDKLIFSYWNDRETENRITAVELDGGVSVYVNDRLLNSSTTPKFELTLNDANEDYHKMFVPAKGSVTLVDTDNDGDYDLIKVVKIDTAVVSSTNTRTNTIYFKNEGRTTTEAKIALNKDTNVKLKEYSITIDGAAADVSALKENDVLSIVTDNWKDPIVFNVEVTRNVIEGTVTARREAEPGAYVVIGGEKYTIAKDVKDEKDTLSVSDIKVGDEGIFFLNADGEIVFADAKAVVSGDYAYLYSVDLNGMFGAAYVRMFTKDGADVAYEISDKIEINGVAVQKDKTGYTERDLEKMFVKADDNTKDDTTVVKVDKLFTGASSSDELTPKTLLKALVDGKDKDKREAFPIDSKYSNAGKDIAKFVTYKVNSNNEITEINIASKKTVKDGEFSYIGTEGSQIAWKESLAMFDGGKSLPDNAVIFFAKADETIADYAVKTVADLVDGSKYQPYYFTNTEDGPAAVLILKVDPAVDKKAPFAIFAGYTETTFDGDKAYSISYWKDGAKIEETLTVVDKEFNLVGAASIDKIDIGSAFLYSLADNGTVKDINVIFNPGTTAPKKSGTALDKNFSGDDKDFTNSDFITIPSALTSDFQLYGTPNNTADNELIYGVVGKVKSTTDGVRLTLVTNTGKFDNTAKAVNVPSTAKVVYYNAKAPSEAKMLSEAVVAEILPSNVGSAVKDNGDFDVANFDADAEAGLNYAFVRVYKDVVTEVIFVRYASDI